METLEQFELFLVKGSRRKSAVSLYKALWKRLLKTPTSNLTKELLDSSLLRLHNEGRKATYLNMLVNFARLYGQCFNRKEFLDYPYFKKEKVLKSVMTDTEIEAFLTLPYPSPSYKNKKDYDKWSLFYSVLAYTGMRPHELAQMTLDRINLLQRTFTLDESSTKTHEPRYIPIPDSVYDKLYVYINTLTGNYLFPSKTGSLDRSGLPCLQAREWGYNFNERLKRMGIKRAGLTVYSLRHSIITRLLDEDVNLYKVQNLVGHKNIETTAQYYHSSLKALKDTVGKDPLATKGKAPEERFKEMLKEMQILSEKYYDVIYSDMTISEDGKEVVVRRKLRA